MPANIEVTSDRLVVKVQGADRIWALRSRLEIPLEHVLGVAPAVEEARKWFHGMRLGGTHLPGVISAGRFYSHGEFVFWDVHDPSKAIGIDLRDERYQRLILEVAEPQAEIARIGQAVAKVAV